MKVLLAGALGQLGKALCRHADDAGHTIVATDIDELDITDPRAVTTALIDNAPDVVINAAAWTAVDAAEEHQSAARRINAKGAAVLATACKAADIPLVHYSTDYVFDGSKEGPYVEDDPTNPVNAYGASKAEGEEKIREAGAKHLILRTSWLFSADGSNFVKTMLRLARERDRLSIVADQYGKPTSAGEVARLTMLVLESSYSCLGTYHVAQPGAVSWYEFAEAIFAEARAQEISLRIQVLDPVSSAEFPTTARRPANSVLACNKFENTFAVGINPWRESLATVVTDLKNVGFFA